MTREELVASLQQIHALTGQCLAGLRTSANPALPSSPGRHAQGASAPSRTTLPMRILDLREEGFFAVPRTAREVQERLSTSYPCELDRVAMALLRLIRRKELRKASKSVDGKKQVAYVW